MNGILILHKDQQLLKTYLSILTNDSDMRIFAIHMQALKKEIIDLYKKYGNLEQIDDDILNRCIIICTKYFKDKSDILNGVKIKYFERGGIVL